MFKNILVALDGSEHSMRALEIAANLAGRYGGSLLLVNVVTRQSLPADLQRPAAKKAEGVYEQLAEEAAREILGAAEVRAREGGVAEVRSAVDKGTPSKAIVDRASREGVDLIVMGTRGLSGFHGLVLGSVAHKVSCLAECPVLTVK